MWMALQSATEQLVGLPSRTLARAFGRMQVGRPEAARHDTGWGWPGGTVTGLRHPVSRLIPGGREHAQALYERRFGARLSPEEWKLGWLKHFVATGKILHAIYGIEILERMATESRMPLDGAGAAKALLALSWDGPHLLRQANQAGDNGIFSLATQLARRTYNFRPVNAQDAMLRAASLASAATTFRGLESVQKDAVEQLSRCLNELVLPDGSHRSHRAEDLLRLTLIILPLAGAMIEAKDHVPEDMRLAIDRMLPMLRNLTLGDGGLVCMQQSPPHREAIRAVFEAAGLSLAPTEPLVYASDAAIVAIRQSALALVADCSENAFEVSHGTQRLCLVECTSPRRTMTSLADHATSTEGAMLRLNGRLGEKTTIFVAANGCDLRCEDHLEPDEEIRIHVPESVELLSGDGIALRGRDNQLWRFTCRGGTISLTSKVITLQPGEGANGRVNWALKKV
jgi:uncharacterized heparinase superfamily protein